MATKVKPTKVVLTNMYRNTLSLMNIIDKSQDDNDFNKAKATEIFKLHLVHIGMNLNKPFKFVDLKSKTLASALKEIESVNGQRVYFFKYIYNSLNICDVTGVKEEKKVKIPVRYQESHHTSSFSSRADLKLSIKYSNIHALVVDSSQILEVDKYVGTNIYNIKDNEIYTKLEDKNTRILNSHTLMYNGENDYINLRDKPLKFIDEVTHIHTSGYQRYLNTPYTPFLDKSGYVLDNYRSSLEDRLEEYKKSKVSRNPIYLEKFNKIKVDIEEILLYMSRNLESKWSKMSTLSWKVRRLLEENAELNRKLFDKDDIWYGEYIEDSITKLEKLITTIKETLDITI